MITKNCIDIKEHEGPFGFDDLLALLFPYRDKGHTSGIQFNLAAPQFDELVDSIRALGTLIEAGLRRAGVSVLPVPVEFSFQSGVGLVRVKRVVEFPSE